MNKQDRRTMLDTANITRKLSIRSIVLVVFVAVIFIVFRLIEIRQIDRRLFFQAYFPYNATSSPFYELTLFGQFAAAIYIAITYTVVDTFIAILVLHVCGQLSSLRRELTNLRVYTKVEFQTKLRNIVRKHEYLNRWDQSNKEKQCRRRKVRDYHAISRNYSKFSAIIISFLIFRLSIISARYF